MQKSSIREAEKQQTNDTAPCWLQQVSELAWKQAAYILEGNMSILSFPDILSSFGRLFPSSGSSNKHRGDRVSTNVLV